MRVVVQLRPSDSDSVSSVWQAALDKRRSDLGLDLLPNGGSAMHRPAAFGVGIQSAGALVAVAIAMPARGDNARSRHNIPGLAHISSVATLPGHWGEGHAGAAVRAVMHLATRRGYARVQLWAHASNAGALHLYGREGFEVSGRRTHDDNGEPIVHLLRELPPIPIVSRPAARLVCLDPDQRVLLLKWRDPADGEISWEPPGGGIEPDEQPERAVLREWDEETSLPPPVLGPTPTLVARDNYFNGTRLVVDEHVFLGRTTVAGEPTPDAGTEIEQQTYLGYAWVPWNELDRLDAPTEPDLVPVLRRLDPVGPWAE